MKKLEKILILSDKVFVPASNYRYLKNEIKTREAREIPISFDETAYRYGIVTIYEISKFTAYLSLIKYFS